MEASPCCLIYTTVLLNPLFGKCAYLTRQSIHFLDNCLLRAWYVPRIVLGSRNEWAPLIHRAPIDLRPASTSLHKAGHTLIWGTSDLSSALPIRLNKMLSPCNLQTTYVHKFT